MAVAFQSVQTAGTNPDSNGSIDVTKPTGLAVGDLMIASGVGSTNNGITFPSGFTQLTEVGALTAGHMRSAIAWKVADSSDVAASTFNFSAGVASISRITGAGSSFVYSGSIADNTANPSFTGVTPKDYGGDILLMQFWSASINVNISGYAIGTSNPSWTEGFEIQGGSTASMAYATRTQVTATGNFSVSSIGANTESEGIIISIHIPYVFSAGDTVTMTDAKKINQSIRKAETVTGTDTSSLEELMLVSNQAKSNVTVTNEVKTNTYFPTPIGTNVLLRFPVINPTTGNFSSSPEGLDQTGSTGFDSFNRYSGTYPSTTTLLGSTGSGLFSSIDNFTWESSTPDGDYWAKFEIGSITYFQTLNRLSGVWSEGHRITFTNEAKNTVNVINIPK